MPMTLFGDGGDAFGSDGGRAAVGVEGRRGDIDAEWMVCTLQRISLVPNSTRGCDCEGIVLKLVASACSMGDDAVLKAYRCMPCGVRIGEDGARPAGYRGVSMCMRRHGESAAAVGRLGSLIH
jgi:hypothetical protein